MIINLTEELIIKNFNISMYPNYPDGEMNIDNDQEINVHNMQEKSSSHYPLGRLTDIVTDVLCLRLSDQRRINLYRILIDSQ